MCLIIKMSRPNFLPESLILCPPSLELNSGMTPYHFAQKPHSNCNCSSNPTVYLKNSCNWLFQCEIKGNRINFSYSRSNKLIPQRLNWKLWWEKPTQCKWLIDQQPSQKKTGETGNYGTNQKCSMLGDQHIYLPSIKLFLFKMYDN